MTNGSEAARAGIISSPVESLGFSKNLQKRAAFVGNLMPVDCPSNTVKTNKNQSLAATEPADLGRSFPA
ncbi:MAG: hypothetical protein Q7T97_15325 [Burkholderiaceae bacterium]|nr:hypothetical protein [Burkholderiaceae bacterium]